MTRQKLSGLIPQAYEHPTDAAALNALASSKAFAELVAKLNEWSFERIVRVQLTGSYLRVSRDNFPDLHRTLTTSCDLLDLPLQPDLYIAPGHINALTVGVKQPLILVYSDAVDLLTPEELLFVIAHEVGHIKSGHVLYYQIAEFLPRIGEMFGAVTLGLGELFGAGLSLALLHWKRMAEFTADRAGLLACQDGEVAVGALMKLAGLPAKYYETMNTEDFMAQAKSFRALDEDKVSKVAKWLSALEASHPWTVMRAHELLGWIDAKGYEAVLRKPTAVAGGACYCMHCGSKLVGNESFCLRCGHALERRAVG